MPAKKKGLNEVDRWTSNGWGLNVGPNTPAQQAAIDKINAENAKKTTAKKAVSGAKKKGK